MAERIVLGLGNPGPEYERTRHNVGFMVVDRIANRWRIDLDWSHGELQGGRGVVRGIPVRLLVTLGFMNRTGRSLLELEQPWQIEDLIVVHDDIDLPVGRLRIRRGGGTGGHRGVASIIEQFGATFDRIRVGVGRPPVDSDIATYVLEPLAPAELNELEAAVERASDAAESLLVDGLQISMNRFNALQTQPVPEDQPMDGTVPRRVPCDDTKH